MAKRWPTLAGVLAEVEVEALLRLWDSLEQAQQDCDTCHGCQGLDSCQLATRGWRQSVRVHNGIPEITLAACRFMEPILEREARNSRLRAAKLEKRFWDRTFATYRPQDEQQSLALKACVRWAQDFQPGRTRTGLYLAGPVGTGKTHLAAAITIAVMERFPELLPLFLPMVDFMEELRDAVANPEASVNDLVEQAVRAPLLILDDMGGSIEWESLPNGKRRLLMGSRGQHPVTDFERRTLYRLINRRYEAGLPVIVTSNCPPDVLEQAYGDRTVSRLIEATDGVLVPGEDWRKMKLTDKVPNEPEPQEEHVEVPDDWTA